MLAEIIEPEAYLPADVVEDSSRDDDLSRIGNGLDSCGDVDPVTVKIAALNHHVAEIDADSQSDSQILGQICVGGFHGLLKLDCAGDGIYGAGEFHQHAVSHDLDNSPAIVGNQRLQNVPSPGFEGGERPLLIGAHQSAITDDVSSEDSSKTALHVLLGHAQLAAPGKVHYSDL